ncbi:hypothetical protein GF359_10390 [candidate division WOR-3 bacterium]|uniref:Auto-transporter adhesin head GIN domain-containing protein n=1 Tax=candidate division WOR-3 bacterium TaxID=2052148 RepID=A0A9D5QDG4_UNCW3|nr:hypothetical protein [candidate division WOR-3 bacterium]
MMRSRLMAGAVLSCIASAAFGASGIVHREFSVGSRPVLILDADPAHLIVETGEEDRIVLDVKLPEEDIYNVSIVHETEKVIVKLVPEGAMGSLMHSLNLYEVDVRVRVPENCDVVLITKKGELEVSGVGGEIRSRSGSPLGQVLKWVFRIGT